METEKSIEQIALEEHAKNKMGAQVLTDLAVNIGSQYVGQSAGGYGANDQVLNNLKKYYSLEIQ